MRGDRIEVLIDVGDGVRSFEVEATRDGRRVEAATVRGTVEVSEVSRSGRLIRSAKFMSSRVVAIVEYPAAELATDQRPPRRKKALENQPSLEL